MAQDLNLTVGVDDSAMLAGLQRAQTAFENFAKGVRSNSEDLQTQLKSLPDPVNFFQQELIRLAGTLAATFGAKSLVGLAEWANTLAQTAKAIGFTTGELFSFQAAVTQAGGTARAASLGIEMFYMKLDQARQGGLSQQVAFERIGISMQDLKDLDDKAIFDKTIQSLAAMPPSAERNRIEVELLSKSFRGLPMQEIAAAMEETRGRFDEFGPVLNDASKAYNTLQADINNFKIAVLSLVQPLMQTFANSKISVDQFTEALKLAASILAGLAAAAVIGRLVAMGQTFVTIATTVRAAAVALKEFSIAEVLAANATGFGSIASLILKFVAAVAVFFGAEALLNRMLDENKTKNQEVAATQEEKVKQDRAQVQSTQQVYDMTAHLSTAIREQTTAFEQNIQRQIALIGVRDANIGKSNEERARVEESTKIYDEYARKIDELNVKLREAQSASPEQGISRTVPALRAAIGELTRQRDIDTKRAGEAAAAQARNNDANKMAELLAQDQIKINKTLADTQIAIDELTMTTGEKKIANVRKQTEELIKQATELRRSQLGTDTTQAQLDQDRILQQTIQSIRDKQQAVVTATQQEVAASRDWSTGWTLAFKEYVSAATDASAQAQNLFRVATRGMEDALVSFAKTGKLSFDSLLASILEAILRSQIQSAFANLFTATGGSGGSVLGEIGSGFTRLLGLGHASGGVVAGGQPIIVGERGPEIFTPSSNGTVTANDQLQGTRQVIYNISAVDAPSFQRMLAANPEFLYAVTEQGRLSIPGQR